MLHKQIKEVEKDNNIIMLKQTKEFDYVKKKDNCYFCDFFNDAFLNFDFDFIFLNFFINGIFFILYYIYKVDWVWDEL